MNDTDNEYSNHFVKRFVESLTARISTFALIACGKKNPL